MLRRAIQPRQLTRNCIPRLSRPIHGLETYELNQTQEGKLSTDLAIHQRALEPKRSIQLHRLARFQNQEPIPEKMLLANAAEVISDITIRLAQRLEALRRLPYLVVLNPYISRIYTIYYNSFRVMSSMVPPTNVEENLKFVEILESLVDSHLNTIPTLAKGFSECSRFMDSEQINEILEEHLQARIGTRLLAEHHISLTHPIGPNFVGAIQKDLKPSQVIKDCAALVGEICSLRYGHVPEIEFEQGSDVTLAYVPVHLEYICTELLKNSFRAVCENNVHAKHPVVVTVIHTGQGVIIRLRDQGKGIPPDIEKDIFRFSYTTFDGDADPGIGMEISGGSSIAGLGYGLPLSRAYAEFFGGKLQLQSYYGWGTDVYLTLKSPMVSGYHREITQ